jgi:hypothetical protein
VKELYATAGAECGKGAEVVTSTIRNGVLLTATVAAVVQLVGTGHERSDPLRVTRLIPVETRELGHHLVDEVFRAELTHTGGPGSAEFALVEARLAHPFRWAWPGFLEVLDDDLEFGTVRPGESVQSRDTFTIRRIRSHSLKLQHLRWDISARPDIVLSGAWAGNWRLTITSKDPTTNRVAAVDEITEGLGVGEPVGLSLLPGFVRCAHTSSDAVLRADCTAAFRLPSCVGNASAVFTLERNGDAITGRGDWAVDAAGDCGAAAGSGGESIEIVGERLSGEVEPEPFSPGVLAKLPTSPAFSALLASTHQDRDEPRAVHDCVGGRWRLLSRPTFPTLRSCIAYVLRERAFERERR